MMGKFLGALLICGAGAWSLGQKWRQGREEERFFADMAASLEQAESSIRFRRLPVPDILREQAQRTTCGWLYFQVIQHMKRGVPLQESWTRSITDVPYKSPKTILQTLEWSGAEDRICLNLRRTAAQLRETLSQLTSQRKQTQKLSLALTASACGLLVILLL